MIVISQALVLSSDPALNLTHPVILWENLVTADNISADTETDDNPASNLGNPATHLFWQGAVSSPAVDEHLTILPGSVDPVDAIGIAAHNFGSAGIAVSVEYLDNTLSPPDYVELIAEFIPADDTPILLRFTKASYEQLRVKLAPGTEAPRAAAVSCGELLVMERGIEVDAPYVPINFGRRSEIVNGRSTAGNFLGRILLGRDTAGQASFRHLTNAFYRASVAPFVVASETLPFFFALKPTEYPNDVGYAWMTNDPQPEFDLQTGRVGISFEFEGVV